MYEVLTQLLSIPNHEVVGAEITEDTITLDIKSTLKGAKCPRCGTYCTELHENHPRTVRDLPIVDRFHVAKAVNEELKKLKNQEKKQHPEVLNGTTDGHR